MNEKMRSYGRALRRVMSENFTLPPKESLPPNDKPSKTKMFTPEEQALAEEFGDLLDKFDEGKEAPQTPHE